MGFYGKFGHSKTGDLRIPASFVSLSWKLEMSQINCSGISVESIHDGEVNRS